MPRGVYDRSHLKSKKAATKAVKAATKAEAAAEKAITKAAAVSESLAKAYDSQEVGGSIGSAYRAGHSELRQHFNTLIAGRQGLGQSQTEHNAELFKVLDAELSATINTLTAWREENFPTAEKKVAVKAEKVEKAAAPVAPPAPTSTMKPAAIPPAPAPAPVAAAPTAPAPAPLPFTPAAVQEVMKQAQG